MVTFVIDDSEVGGKGTVKIDLTDVIPGYANPSDQGEITIVGEPGLDDIDDITLQGIGDDSSDPDIIRFDLTTFRDSFSITVSGKDGAGSDDCIEFVGASNIVNLGGGEWRVTYSNGGQTYTIDVDADDAQVKAVDTDDPDGVVDGEDSGEVMRLGYNDNNAPTDGGGDRITNDADVIEGNRGDDTIDGAGGNDTIDGGRGDDEVFGGAGRDSIDGGRDDDLLDGGSGRDTIDGGSGNDTIIGDSQSVIEAQTFSWAAIGLSSGDEVRSGTIDVGTVSVDYDFRSVESQFSPEPLFTDGLSDADGPISSNSSIGFEEDGTGTFDFSDPVENLQFRINDFEDEKELVTIRAFDENNNPIRFNVQLGRDVSGTNTDGVSGVDTFEGNDGSTNDLDADGSILVTIPGPVSRVEIEFESKGGTVALSDLVFDAPTAVAGDGDRDVLSGGDGNDVIEGREGDDTLSGDSGNDQLDGGTGRDELSGGSGRDTLEGGSGRDTLDGGSSRDTLDGGTGADDMTGGGDTDVFIELGGDGADTIRDFNAGNRGSINDGNQTNNDFVDLSAFYNDRSVNRVNNADSNPDNDFKHALEMMRADAADGRLDGRIDGVNYSNRIGDVDLRLRNDGDAVTGTDLTFDNTNVVCFTPGTMIATILGLCAIEDLEIGDLILTMDNGYQPLRWIGRRTLDADVLEAAERLRPVRIKADALGPKVPETDLVVSPQHRMLLRSKIAERMFGQYEVLLSARSLTDLKDVDVKWDCEPVTYIHLMFDNHEIIFANGTPAESLYLGAQAIKSLPEESREEILEVFPQVASPDFQQDLARFAPGKGRQIKKLLIRHQANTKDVVDLPM